MKTNKIKTKSKIILEDLSDEQLLKIVEELQQNSWEENSIIRTLSKQFFGGDSLTHMLLVSYKLLPVVTERFKKYSLNIN